MCYKCEGCLSTIKPIHISCPDCKGDGKIFTGMREELYGKELVHVSTFKPCMSCNAKGYNQTTVPSHQIPVYDRDENGRINIVVQIKVCPECYPGLLQLSTDELLQKRDYYMLAQARIRDIKMRGGII